MVENEVEVEVEVVVVGPGTSTMARQLEKIKQTIITESNKYYYNEKGLKLGIATGIHVALISYHYLPVELLFIRIPAKGHLQC